MNVRHVAALAILMSLVSTPLTARASIARYTDPNLHDTRASWREQYPGDEVDLPYGWCHPVTVLDHARRMASVRVATDMLLARGYVRRVDTDAAFTDVGYACALLGFEKPGHTVDELQPVLYVITRAVEVPDVGWRPASQVFSSVLRDSSGVAIPAVAAEDSSLFVFGVMQSGDRALDTAMSRALAGRAPDIMNPDLPPFTSYRHSVGEFEYVCPPSVSAGMQALIEEGWRQAAIGAALGATASAPALRTGGWGVATVAMSAIVGAYRAYSAYWYQRPDTTQVRR